MDSIYKHKCKVCEKVVHSAASGTCSWSSHTSAKDLPVEVLFGEGTYCLHCYEGMIFEANFFKQEPFVFSDHWSSQNARHILGLEVGNRLFLGTSQMPL
jgi:hypothetical protein